MSHTGKESGRSDRRLAVEFEIDPGAETSCPLGEFDEKTVEIRQQLAREECFIDIELHPDDCGCDDPDCTKVVHSTNEIDAGCLCTVFTDLGCVPQITTLSRDRVVIETYLPSREELTELVDGLRAIVDGLSLRRLKRVETTDGTRQREIATLDLHELTEKQREAATTAVATGYYSTPREVSLGELAAELGVSKPALSERLSRVESKLAMHAFAD